MYIIEYIYCNRMKINSGIFHIQISKKIITFHAPEQSIHDRSALDKKSKQYAKHTYTHTHIINALWTLARKRNLTIFRYLHATNNLSCNAKKNDLFLSWNCLCFSIDVYCFDFAKCRRLLICEIIGNCARTKPPKNN